MRTRVHLRTLWKHRWILATAMCAGAAMAIALAVRQSPVYLAEAQVSIAPEIRDGRASGGAAEEELAPYATHVESLAMAQTVVRRESLDFSAAELAGKVEANVLPEVRVVSIGVTDSDASQAQTLANSFATAFVEEGAREVGVDNVRAAVLEAAPLPVEPVSPKPVRDGLVGLGLGALAGILLTYSLKRPASKTSERKPKESIPQEDVAAAHGSRTPPRVDLKPARRTTDDLVSEDAGLDEEIDVPAMDEEEPALPDKPKDPFAIYPARRTFLPKPDRSPVRTTAQLGEDESISDRIREAVRRGMAAASSTPASADQDEKRQESDKLAERLRAATVARAEPKETEPDSDVSAPDLEYEDFWQMGREHHDSDEKAKPRDPKSKKKRP